MSKRFLIFSVVIIFLILSAFSIKSHFTVRNTEPIYLNTGDDYKQEWKQIDSLEAVGLPKSALKLVNKIYKESKLDKNISQLVKALLYQVKITNYVEEDGLVKAINTIENEIKTSKTPITQILHSINAELYYRYYTINKWKVFQRTRLSEIDSNDLLTWDAKRMSQKIVLEYRLSLSQADSLQRMPISALEPLILSENNSYLRTWPTIYDFVAYRTINTFSKDILSITSAVDTFDVSNSIYLSKTKYFLDIDINFNDSLSLKYLTTKYLQDLVRFHSELENPDALIDAELLRLKTIYSLSNLNTKDELYIKALGSLLEQYRKVPYADHIRYRIAEFSQKKAAQLDRNINEVSKFNYYNDLALKNIKDINKAQSDSILVLKANYLLSIMQRSSLNMIHEKVILPNNNFPIRIETKNVDKAQIKVFKIDEKKFKQISDSRIYGKELYLSLIQSSVLISQREINLRAINDYRLHSTEIIESKLEKGRYFIALEGYSNNYDSLTTSYSSLRVSELSVLKSVKSDTIEVLVLNRKTGIPMQNVNVQFWYSTYSYKQRKQIKRKAMNLQTNENGLVKAVVEPNRNILLDVYTKDDKLNSSDQIYTYHKNPSKINYKTHFFTDRNIYRPGQTIYFKAIALKDSAGVKTILENKKQVVTLYDANYQKVLSLDLITNEYGSISGSFVLPNAILTGRMHLETKNGSAYFNVEEYKRPKFEVTLDDFEGNYKLNEKVLVEGSAIGFSGENIVSAQYKYRVVRKPDYSYYWRYFPIYFNEIEIAKGNGLTNEKGKFSFEFIAKSEKEKESVSYNYSIEIDVIDITGETHSITKNVNVGTDALKLNISIDKLLSINKIDSFKIDAVNLNNVAVDTEIKVVLKEIESGKTLLNDRLWADPDTFFITKEIWKNKLPNYNYTVIKNNYKVISKLEESLIKTKESPYWKLNKKLKEGTYKIELSATDAFGKKVYREQFFTLFDEESSAMPFIEKDLFKVLSNNVEPNNNVEILIGSSFSKVKILLEIDRKNRATEKQWIKLNNSKQKLIIPVTEEDRGGLSVRMTFVYKNRVYKKSERINVPFTNKQLDIKFETFRNKLIPGQKELWRIKIKGHKGEKLASEMLVSMYDASLDQFINNNWNFNILDYFYSKNSFQTQNFGITNAVLVFNNYKYQQNPRQVEPKLNWFGFSNYSRKYTRSKSSIEYNDIVMDAVNTDKGNSRSIVSANLEIIDEEETESSLGKDEDVTEIPNNKPVQTVKPLIKVQIRKNFNETAFFYPQLKCNEDGDVIFSFKMPESLTKWKFRGFAHTKDLKYGFINEEVISQKSLMAIPKPPRFFRAGDKIEFPVKVVNLSKETLNVNALLNFYDALTMKNITAEIVSLNKKYTLSIKAGQSGIFTAKLSIPEGYSTISYKVIVSSKRFSDGEERAIPVLTNRILVTESLPLSIRKKGTKNYKFDKLLKHKSKTLKNYNYTLEVTSNPAWYAVQALPYLAEYPNECAEQVFSRFYANALASHIANSNPKIKTVFDKWRNAPDSKALLSNLEKNQDLKATILAESPWVMDAQNETEQKRRIAMLFDLNQLASSQKLSLDKLKKMQVGSGAWPWFKGMSEDRYITQLIISGMGHLSKLNVIDIKKDAQLRLLVVSAIRFLDNEIKKDYKKLKINNDSKQLNNSLHAGNIQIQYLYMRSFFNHLVGENKSESYNYYLKNAQQFWLNQSQYLQAMIALTSIRINKNKTGIHVEDQIVASLKENALIDDEMGMYWKNNSGYYWYQAPIEKQAIMIELFSEYGNEQENIENLKAWLLKQKQTQNWKTTRATADAIYALLLQGTDILSNNELLEVSLGGKKVNLTKFDKIEAGTGYFKKSWSENEINSKMGEIKISKNTDGVAWGAVYWQYFEDLDKISVHKTPLSIEKKLFIENTTMNGKELVAVNKSEIKVGDKIIIRIILRVDRNMEYVHLKDMRASGFEPLNVISTNKYRDGLAYYESTKDVSTNFFFNKINKGTYVFEYPVRAVHKGDFSNGISNIQCMYAPEFTSHSEGIRVNIK